MDKPRDGLHPLPSPQRRNPDPMAPSERPAPPAALRPARALLPCAALGLGALGAAPALAQTAGLLAGGAEALEPLTLSVMEPLAKAPYTLESGGYYSLDIVGDGSAELSLVAPELFRNVWIDEVVVNDLEVRPLGLDSLEFDDEGTVTIRFVAIRPGTYTMRIPGTSGESQRAEFTIR